MTVIRNREYTKKLKKRESVLKFEHLPPSPRFHRSDSKGILSIFHGNSSIYNDLSSILNSSQDIERSKLEVLARRIYQFIYQKFDRKIDIFRSYSLELHYFSYQAYEAVKLKFDLRDAEMNIIFITHYLGKGVAPKDIELTLKLLQQPYTTTRYIPGLIERGFIYRKKLTQFKSKSQRPLMFTTSKGSEVIKLYSKIISEMIMNFKSEFYARRKAMIYRRKKK